MVCRASHLRSRNKVLTDPHPSANRKASAATGVTKSHSMRRVASLRFALYRQGGNRPCFGVPFEYHRHWRRRWAVGSDGGPSLRQILPLLSFNASRRAFARTHRNTRNGPTVVHPAPSRPDACAHRHERALGHDRVHPPQEFDDGLPTRKFDNFQFVEFNKATAALLPTRRCSRTHREAAPILRMGRCGPRLPVGHTSV